MSDAKTVVGGWSAWDFQLSGVAERVLEQVTSGLLGAKFEGLAFSSQLVNGTNYAFVCESIATTDPPNVGPVLIHAHAPTKGSPVITNIVRLGPSVNQLPGGFSSWSFPAGAEAQNVFQRAVSKLVGVGYDAIGATTEIVAGANYCFLARALGVYPGAEPTPALLSIFQPLQGAPQIREISMLQPWPMHVQPRAAE